MRKLLLLAVIATIVFLACGKDDTPTPSPPDPTDTTAIELFPAANVFIAGDSFDLTPNKNFFAVYWNKGRKIYLPNDTLSFGTGIAVSGTNVYVSAQGVKGNKVTYWKNLEGIQLSDPTIVDPVSHGISVSGNDVYTLGVCYTTGYQKQIPIYWKNQGTAIKIDGPSLSLAFGINVSGDDVYIAGSTGGSFTGYQFLAPCYWKNGVPNFLPSPVAGVYTGVAKSIQVVGSDIYVAGDVSLSSGSHVGWGVYWKNGVPVKLTGPNDYTSANGMTVVGNDVYVAGYVKGIDGNPHAAYWKNGVVMVLDPNYNTVANAIAVEGDVVHVAGNRGLDLAMYWKNGKPVILGRGRARAIAIIK